MFFRFKMLLQVWLKLVTFYLLTSVLIMRFFSYLWGLIKPSRLKRVKHFQDDLVPVDLTHLRCTLCKPTLVGIASSEHWGRHMQKMHRIKKPFQCGVCETQFKKYANLREHIVSKEGLKMPPKAKENKEMLRRRLVFRPTLCWTTARYLFN